MTEPQPVKQPNGDIWGAVKWICILLVVLIIAAGVWKAWSVATAPARVVSSSMDSATEMAKAGAQNTSEAVAKVTGRLDIQVTNQKRLNGLSEAAFGALNVLQQTQPSLKDRTLRANYLRGADNRVCTMTIDFGTGAMAVWAAADNDAFAPSKALGGTEDRMIRMVLFAEGDSVGMRSFWDSETKAWNLRWKRTTLKKPINDAVAEARILDVLEQVSKDCSPS